MGWAAWGESVNELAVFCVALELVAMSLGNGHD